MRFKFAVVACSLIGLLVDPVLAQTILVAKVYRDYPGYINPAVCENPNVSKPRVAPTPHKIEVPLPVVPETLAGPAAAAETPAPAPAPVIEPVTIPLPVTTAPVMFPASPPVPVVESAPFTLPPSAPPIVPETLAGPAAAAETPAPAPAPVIEPVTIPLPPSVVPAMVPVAMPAPTVESAPVILPSAAAPVVAPASAPVPMVETASGVLPPSAAPVLPSTPLTVMVPLPKVPETAAGNPEPCKPGCGGYLSGDSVQAPYLSVWAGVVATHDVDVDYQGYSSEAEIDNGFAGGVAAGYDFGKLRLEVEGSYRNSNAAEGDADLKVRALMANVYADFETGGTATPYLGAGVGVADVDIEGEDDQVLAGQVAAGVLFAVTEKVAIDLGYRFMMTDDPEIAGAELELRQHTALLGVQIKF